MITYEYKVVPAPAKGEKAKGVKTPEARFARALEAVINEMASGGWEYLRAETLPHEERSGLTGSSTTFRNVLIFRRSTGGVDADWAQAVPGGSVQVAAEPAKPLLTASRTAERRPPAGGGNADVSGDDRMATRAAPLTASHDAPPLRPAPAGDAAQTGPETDGTTAGSDGESDTPRKTE